MISILVFAHVLASGKATRSAQNHAAYKRQNGRRGSATMPFILPIVPKMAKKPVHDSLLFRVTFHQPQLYAPTPLTYDGLLSSYSTPAFSEGDLDLLCGLYQRIELDSINARIKQFKEGNRLDLQKGINSEIRAGIKRWKHLWRKISFSCIEDIEYKDGMDLVHLQWISRSIEHLQEELYLLSTTNRACLYLTSVEVRTVEVPI
jgi:hypothetical protein